MVTKINALIYILLIFMPLSLFSSEPAVKDSLPVNGREYKGTKMFREYFHTNDFVYYLDNIDDNVIYQSETTGAFNMPDRYLFSVGGNSYQWNRYYIDGFRTDSRYMVGSTYFMPDMYKHDLTMDYHRSGIFFSTLKDVPNSVNVTYNIGGLGGISAGTKEIINIFHKTASERVYKPIDYRNKMNGAASVSLDYSIPVNGKKYLQSLYVDYGNRDIVAFDEKGITEPYKEDFFKVNLNGQLPVEGGRMFDRVNYLFHASARDNMNSEVYYGKDETARHNAYSLSVYGVKNRKYTRYTSGLTLATNKIHHNDINYARNIIDQDGEALEPWYPDGYNSELNYAVNFEHIINNNMKIVYDGYNSVINFTPEKNSFTNRLYLNMPNDKSSYQSLYIYDWQTDAFWSALFENTVGIDVHRRWTSWIDFNAGIDLTVDAMILKDKSMFRPGWQANVGVNIHPCKWFNMEINASRNRIAFNYDQIRFLSSRYMYADIYYWNDKNGDRTYQPDEKGSYFTSTGGKYHHTADMLKQPSYFVFDMPIHFTFGNHRISFLNTYRKYFNTWFTSFDGDASDYGHFEKPANTENSSPESIFFFNGGTPVNYIVGYYPKEYRDMMNAGNWTKKFSDTPYYFSSVIKYQYTGPKFFFSLSWQSFLMAGASGLGNGVLQNNLGVLTETTANPNNMHKAIGRYDQDRAYVARMHIGYNITENFSVALTGKFKDGQPFSSFYTQLYTDAEGNTQAAMWNGRTKGIDPFTGDFGSREDAFFNFDLRAKYRGNIMKHPFEVELFCYNIYDFGTELTEYVFNPVYRNDNPSEINNDGRHAMSLSIPRGLIASFRIEL